MRDLVSILTFLPKVALIFVTFVNFELFDRAFASQIHIPLSKEGEYESIRDVSLEILRRYPPNEYHYVGVGRSPTPFFAFYRSIGMDDLTEIPGSSLRTSTVLKADDPGLERIANHFDKYFPKMKMLKGRKIMLLDYAETGQALDVAAKYIDVAANRRGLVVPVTKVALGQSQYMDKVNFRDRNIDIVDINPILSELLYKSSYDSFARWDRYVPWKDEMPYDSPDRIEYQSLITLMKNRIKKDSELRPLKEYIKPQVRRPLRIKDLSRRVP